MKGIKSQLATERNAVSILSGRESQLSAKMIPLIASLSGNEKYSIASLPKVAIAKAMNAVDYLISNKKIEDAEYVGFPIKKDALDQGSRLEKLIYDNYERLSASYALIRGDAAYYGYDKYLGAMLSERHAKGSIQQFLDINAKVFSMFPLQLTMLFAGENANE